jgi:glutathionyl-hydroquinone reductase
MNGPTTTSTTASTNPASPRKVSHRFFHSPQPTNTSPNRTQEAYEKAVQPLFASLDRAEAHLAQHAAPYYFGPSITEADIRLYTTIIRFDPVYVQHFKCNIRDIRSGYPALHKWMRHLYWDVPAFGETTQFEHIKKHYTKSHRQINPHSITPVGPVPDILPKDEEVAAAAAAIRSTNQ